MCTLMVWKRKGASRVSQLIPSCDSYSRSCARSTGGESMFYFSKVLLSFVVVMVGIIFECVILSFIVFVSGGDTIFECNIIYCCCKGQYI